MNGISNVTIIADIPTNVNHELCPPNQCDTSDKDIAKSGLDKNCLRYVENCSDRQ